MAQKRANFKRAMAAQKYSCSGFTSRVPAIRTLEKFSILSIMPKMENYGMETTRVTASEFQQAFGALSDKARRDPVVITKHGRDSLVVMAAEEWERLRRRDRRVGLTAELPEEWAEVVRQAKVPDEFAALDAELK